MISPSFVNHLPLLLNRNETRLILYSSIWLSGPSVQYCKRKVQKTNEKTFEVSRRFLNPEVMFYLLTPTVIFFTVIPFTILFLAAKVKRRRSSPTTGHNIWSSNIKNIWSSTMFSVYHSALKLTLVTPYHLFACSLYLKSDLGIEILKSWCWGACSQVVEVILSILK